MSGKLELIDKTTISTSSANVHIANVFSSKYDTYKIVWSNLTSVDTSNTHISLRFHDGSSVITADYNYILFNVAAHQAATAQVDDSGSFISRFFGDLDGGTGQATNGVGYIFNPFGSGYTFAQSESGHDTSQNGGTFECRATSGVLRNSSSMTGFVIHNPNRNYDEGEILTYGIAD